MDKEIQANQWWLYKWHEKTILLTQLDPSRWDGGKEMEKGKRRRKERFLERECLTSL